MSHTITGTNSYSGSVTVPDAGDAGTTRAQDVTTIAQRALNNDVAIKAIADAALPASGGVVTGDISMSGHTLTVSTVTAANVAASSAVTAASVTATGTVTCNNMVTAFGVAAPFGTVECATLDAHTVKSDTHLYAPGGGRVEYEPAVAASVRRKRIRVPLMSGSHTGLTIVNSAFVSTGAAYVLNIPISRLLPSGSEVEKVCVRMEGDVAGATIALQEVNVDWNVATSTPTTTNLATGSYTAGTGVQTIEITASGNSIQLASHDQSIRISAGTHSSGVHIIYAVSIIAVTTGPVE